MNGPDIDGTLPGQEIEVESSEDDVRRESDSSFQTSESSSAENWDLDSTDKKTKLINKKCFKVADSQVATRWGNITEFKNFDLITPNEREARFALADQDSTVGKLSGLLQETAKCKNLILKLGERGVFCASSSSKEKSTYFSFIILSTYAGTMSSHPLFSFLIIRNTFVENIFKYAVL